MTIYYYVPNIQKIAGGVKVMYQHVRALCNLGLDAKVLKHETSNVEWFDRGGIDERLVPDTRLYEDDTLVVPEIEPHVGSGLHIGRKILFAQNVTFVKPFLKENSYAGIGYTEVMCVSSFVKDHIIPVAGPLRIHIVFPALDTQKFQYDPRIRKVGFLMLPRKGPDIVRKLTEELSRRGQQAICVDNVSEDKMANYYKRAQFFVPTGEEEGFALPPLEAMSCGCVVVGFDGHGGKEYMRDGFNCIVPTEQTYDSLLDSIDRAISNPDNLLALQSNGLCTAAKYTINRLEETLSKIFVTPD